MAFNDKSITVSNGQTGYVGIATHVRDQGAVGVHIAWEDATSNATITWESSNYPVDASVAGNAWEWYEDPSVVISGPNGTAAGCTFVHLSANYANNNRLKIVAAADTTLRILTTQ